MALIASATHGSYPGMRYEFYAEQTGGSGNSRTVKLTLKLKCGGSSSSSWYGYAVNWRGYVNGTWSGWATVKGTESWNATQDFRTYSTTITTDVGTTSSKTIKVGFATDSQIDADWDFSKTDWNFNVGATNRAPSAPSNLTIRTAKGGASLSGIIPENINSFYVDWSAASDADGDTIYYDLQEQRNGGSWTSIDGNGTDCAHAFNTVGGEGTSYRYWVDARDSKGAHSANGVYSATVTKNVLTAGSFTGHSGDINFNTTEFTLRFNKGSNNNGSAVYSMCYSDNVTVYNATETSETSQTIKIWKSGAVPSGPYIKFDELKNYFAGSSYNGRLHVGLRTRNDYGTHKWSHGSIGVDLRVAPNPARNQSIVANSNHSPIYKKVASSNNYYFIPDGSNVCRVHWNLGSGKLGESVRYEVYVSYNNGGWQKLADVPQGTNDYAYYNHVIPKQTVSQQFKYLIRTITSYGYHSDAITPAQTLHFYNTPGIAVGTITRGATTCDVKVTVKTNTSIPNVSTVGSWLTNPATSRGNLSASQGEQNIAVTGLTDAGTYTLKVTYNDNTGFSGNQVRDIAIGQNTPIFFVNKYGIGVNGNKANSKYSISVKGSGFIDGLKLRTYGGLEDCNTYKPDEIWVNKTGTKSLNRPADWCTVFNIGADNNSNFQLACSYTASAPGFWVRGRNDTSGNYHSWAKVYTTLNKPTAADVGAAPASHTHSYLPLTGGTLTGDLVLNNKRLKITGASTNLEIGIGGNDLFFKNTKSDSFLQFHNNGNLYINSNLIGTRDYPIIGSDTKRWFSRIAPVLGDGVIEIGRFIDFHKANNDGADYTARFDANGNCIWCSTSIVQGSDRELKENIKYLDDESSLLITEEESSSTLFKDFIKDFKFATYNYIGSGGKCFGFIAQDIVEHPVGKLLLQEHEMDVINKKTREIEGTETTLAFGLADYTSVVAKALQEEIIEKDEKIIELETKLEKQQKQIEKQQRQIEKQQKQIDMIIGKLGL